VLVKLDIMVLNWKNGPLQTGKMHPASIRRENLLSQSSYPTTPIFNIQRCLHISSYLTTVPLLCIIRWVGGIGWWRLF